MVWPAHGKRSGIFYPPQARVIVAQIFFWVARPGFDPNLAQVSRVLPKNRVQNLGIGANLGRRRIRQPQNRGTLYGRCPLVVIWVGWLSVGAVGRGLSQVGWVGVDAPPPPPPQPPPTAPPHM